MTWTEQREILVVHLGGLGDVCLSESVFLSLARHFGQRLTAAGNERFLSLFSRHFSSVCSIEGREWLYLFADHISGPKWERIILIGKDRSGAFRDRLQRFSKDELVFIDMYPESKRVHVEDYQLGQLEAFDIKPVRRTLQPRSGRGLILYPERGFRKQKWPYERFLEVYGSLRGEELPVFLLEPFDTETPHKESFRLNQLREVVSFLERAGIFVSNDCGIAHLAGSCGLTTITLFSDTDPVIWHPAGDNHALLCAPPSPSVAEILDLIGTVSGGLIGVSGEP